MQTASFIHPKTGVHYSLLYLERKDLILVWKGDEKNYRYQIRVYWSDSRKTFQLNCNCASYHLCEHRKQSIKKFRWNVVVEPGSEWARVNEQFIFNQLDVQENLRRGLTWNDKRKGVRD